jgi:signal transduction histidine kinase/ActR/RegA family two-component response regulator
MLSGRIWMSDWVHLGGRLARYATPVVSTAVAAALSLLLIDWIHPSATPLFIVAVAVSTWAGGLRPGLIATTLSVAAMAWLMTTVDPSARPGAAQLLWAGCLALVVLLVGSVDLARRRAAQMLNERDTRLRLVSEQIPAGLWSTDDQLRLSSRFGGVPTLFKGRLGMSLPEFFPGAGDDFPPIAAHLRALQGESSTFELPWEGRLFQAHVEPLQNVQGEIIGVIGVVLDISERQRGERRLQEAKALAERARGEAEQATRARDRFLAMLSHELRTPLTPALMATAVLEGRDDLPDGVRADLEMIRRNIQLEARLIDDLLDLTRVAAGKLKLELRPVDAHAVLRDAVEVCRADVRSQQVSLSLDLAAERHRVHGDAARLQQVCWNLIKNAIKFTPPGGRIVVRSSNPDPADPARLVLEVSDTGIGIDADLLPRIFDAFEQGGDSTTRRFGGLGLGLAISRALVESHGGRITVESAGMGRGATFRVELQASAVEPSAAAAPPTGGEVPDDAGAPAYEQAGALHVLLVEDHADTRLVLSRLLNSIGHVVTTADSATEAVRIIGEDGGDTFDLLVSDLSLPDGTGLEVVRALRGRRRGQPVKAVALSGFGMAEDVRKSLDAGFDRHLTKPVSLDALLEAVDRLTAARTAD